MTPRLVSAALTATAVFMAACGPIRTTTTLPKLPGGPAGATAAAETAAGTGGGSPSSSMLAAIEYRLGAPLPQLPATALAYAVATGSADDERHRVATALGLTDADRRLIVDRTSGSWSFDANCAAPPGVDISGAGGSGQVVGFACSSPSTSAPGAGIGCGPGSTVPCTSPKPAEPVRPADLPTQQVATDRAKSLFRSLGVIVSKDGPHVTDGVTQWLVSTDPGIDGVPTIGRTTTAVIGPKASILTAQGFLGTPEKLGAYPLVDAETVGFKRLVDSELHRPRPMIALGMPCRADAPNCGGPFTPAVATITGVHLALQQIGRKLVPVFVFEAGSNETAPAVPAVIDRLLQPVTPTAPTTMLQPEPGQPGHSPGVAPGGLPTQP